MKTVWAGEWTRLRFRGRVLVAAFICTQYRSYAGSWCCECVRVSVSVYLRLYEGVRVAPQVRTLIEG